MFTKKSYNIDFDPPKMKIFSIFPAFNDTFVLLVQLDHNPQNNHQRLVQQVLHIDHTGRELFQYTSTDTINNIAMINDRIVVFCDVDQRNICYLNLQSREIAFIKHGYICKSTASIDFNFFPDTKLLCLVERCGPKDNTMMMTYFLENGEATNQYTTKRGQYRYPDLVTKGNTHSMMIWAKNAFKENIELWIYDLKQSSFVTPKPRRLYIVNPIFTSIDDNMLLSLVNVWQCRPGCFILSCDWNKDLPDSPQVKNNNYFYDVNHNFIRETNFSFEGRYNECLIEPQNLGNYSIFPTFKYKAGKSQESPIYVIDNERQSIIGEVPWFCDTKLHLFLPGYDLNSLLLTQFDSGDVRNLKINTFTFGNNYQNQYKLN